MHLFYSVFKPVQVYIQGKMNVFIYIPSTCFHLFIPQRCFKHILHIIMFFFQMLSNEIFTSPQQFKKLLVYIIQITLTSKNETVL